MEINEVKNKVTDSCGPAIEKVTGAFKADPKSFLIKIGAAVLAVILVIVLLSVGINAITNTYKTPIKTMEKYANAKKYYDNFDKSLDSLNGFAEKEMKAIYKLYKSTEDYKEDLEDNKEDFNDRIDDLKDEYGKNYKYTYKITDKEELEREDVKEFRENLRNMADSLESQIESTEDYDSDDWEDMADDMGFDGNKKKAKAYISALKDLRKVYKSAKVTKGYELTVETKLTGSELDEPKEDELTIRVYKVNGRWISASALY